MKKIASLFKRDYDGTRQAYDEVVPGCEWVQVGEGVATIKYDGMAAMVRAGVLYKRYDRKLQKGPYKRKKRDAAFVPALTDYKSAPVGWEACETEPNHHTGHWPGWVPVGAAPEDKWFVVAWKAIDEVLADGAYELVGPKVGTNPYSLEQHEFWAHGEPFYPSKTPPRDYTGLHNWFVSNEVEGIVWHHPDGRMCKIKRRDFGFPWPV